MIRHFVRLYAAIMIPIVVPVVLAHHLGTLETSRAAYVSGLRAGLSAHFAAPLQAIGALHVEDWEADLPRLRKHCPSDVQLELVPVAFRRLKSNGAENARFQNGDVAFTGEKMGPRHAYQRIPGTPLALGIDVDVPRSFDISPTLYIMLAIMLGSVVVLWSWFHPSWLALERLGVLTEEVAASPRKRGAFGDGTHFGHPFATTIDRITTRLDDLLNVRRTQSNSVAHELTAPISKLSFALEMLKDDPTAAHAPALLARMRDDLRELDYLVEESLEYARLGNSRTLVIQPGSLTAILQRASEAALGLPAHDKAIGVFGLEGQDDLVACDAKQIVRAVFNLLRNATQYAHSTIEVRAERIGATTWIHVDDDGLGIAVGDRERLLKPFVRVEDHSTGASRGHGLGLAIVQLIARLHGGNTVIGQSPLGGARVSIHWQGQAIALPR